jgi:hypothetical protein
MNPATISTPKPGIFRKRSIRGAKLCGVTAANPDKTPPKTPSKELTSHDRTQMVIANGNQTISPVSMYFLNGTLFPDLSNEKFNWLNRFLGPQPWGLHPHWALQPLPRQKGLLPRGHRTQKRRHWPVV